MRRTILSMNTDTYLLEIKAISQMTGRLLAVAVLLAGLSACATVEDVVSPPDDEPTGADMPEANEPDEPAAPSTRTIDGYRIQILTTGDKDEADRQVTQAEQWWRALAPAERPPYVGEEDVYVKVAWRQPYYRVRIGRFASRSEAERALDTVSRQYSDAFIVPDRVTVTRVW